MIPELKLQVTELQKQKQELEADVQQQRRDLAGKYELSLTCLPHLDWKRLTLVLVALVINDDGL